MLLSTDLVLVFSDSESQWLSKHNGTNYGGNLAFYKRQVVNAGRGKEEMAHFCFATEMFFIFDCFYSSLSFFFSSFGNHPVITKVIK